MREEDYLHHFLINLDGAYASIQTHLLGQEPLPMLDRAYNQVIQAKRLHGGELSSSKEERDSIMDFAIHPDARASTLEGGSGAAVQPMKQPAQEDVCVEVLDNTVEEQGVHKLTVS
ncbi:uncharacterized protein A4U43_C09F8850 [Asparagus officinalis]|uniref:Uncharacterized protein n=1 Tax=Asparagus officinalis TaxID=4686 RepID=A0A5P1E699_ASPOF|nr:uncharacterized protein A4U43_C09F8850 [Asparagus officinalis]